MQERLASPQHIVADAYEAIELYYEKGWTDGLPVVPPTEDRVRQFLEACGRKPGDVIGTVPTRGREITAEKIAVNAVMAGCRPEYMPVLIAVIEAMTEPDYNYHGSLASTGGSAPMIVINGPIARTLKVNAGVNAFGPGFRANATIGRAVRLIIINVTDGAPGLLDRSTLGHGGKYSMCIAENEDASPWEPLHVQRGLRPTDSGVTVFAALSALQISDGRNNTPEAFLDNMAEIMKAFNVRLPWFVVATPPENARIFRNAGWTKKQAREYLHERAFITTAQLRRRPRSAVNVELKAAEDEKHPIVSKAEEIYFIVVGGDAGGFPQLIQPWGSVPITKLVKA